jgi:hypothetical protein
MLIVKNVNVSTFIILIIQQNYVLKIQFNVIVRNSLFTINNLINVYVDKDLF